MWALLWMLLCGDLFGWVNTLQIKCALSHLHFHNYKFYLIVPYYISDLHFIGVIRRVRDMSSLNFRVSSQTHWFLTVAHCTLKFLFFTGRVSKF